MTTAEDVLTSPLEQIRAELEIPVIAFTGSRKFNERPVVEEVMRRLVRKYPRCRIRVGDARGLDYMVGREATRWGKWPEVEVCHWPPANASNQEKWIAASERNQRVVYGSMEHPGLALRLYAFFAPGPRTSGTSNAVLQAIAAGIPIDIYHDGNWQKLNAEPE